MAAWLVCLGAADPLTAKLRAGDANRFAELFVATNGRPNAEQLQASYLDGSEPGVGIFTPDRIVNAQRLAAAVAAERERYAYAIATCLPLLDSMNSEMRSVYLGYRGLLPELPLPEVYVVFGAGNSGGTAVEGAQVIGLEVMCGPGTTPEQFRKSMRSIFAHETVHSWQHPNASAYESDPLLAAALSEGVPDYLASLVTGEVPGPERDDWARAHERWLWTQFQSDRARLRTSGSNGDSSVFRRWFANYGNAPEGWQAEAGYWIGMRIAEQYVAQADDKPHAIRELIAMENPQAILRASGYDGR